MKGGGRPCCMSARQRTLQAVLGYAVEDLVASDHPYRKLLSIVPFDELCRPLRAKYSRMGRGGYPAASAFKILLLQWMEDLSDREAERFLRENLAAKFFCGFTLTEDTPDYSTICTFRDRIGLDGLAALFNHVRRCLQDAGIVREVFTFVDATQLISKLDLWRERDQGIEAGIGKLTNANVSQVAADPDARFGRKGGTKWFGYKLHVGIDMSQGLITRICATPANVEDMRGAKHVLPRHGMVFADKAYGVGEADFHIRRRGLHNGAILKKSMRRKVAELDRWRTGVRMPYEGTFSKFEKRTRYRGLKKCQFQAFMQALSHNFKRLLAIDTPPLTARPSCA